jgi:CheY-like chemotaxis protein
MGDSRKVLDGISILVVDDNLDALDLVMTILTYYGALAVTATDATQGLAYLGRMRVDAIISDLSMPGSSGLDFIRAVRALPSGAGGATPAIALTAFNEARHRQAAEAAGFQAYLLKPFEPSALVAEILRLVRAARATSEETTT